MSGRCYYCEVALVKSHPKERRLTWDHKVPKAKGGTDAQSNLVTACFQCNQEKGVLTESEFKAVLAMRRWKQQQSAPKTFENLFKKELTLEDHAFLYEIGVEAI